jgi:transcriptional regulator with XRE-family HTH domain
MASTKRNQHELAHDRLEISRLYLRGLTQAEIAARMGVSQPQICYDLRLVRRGWQASAVKEWGERLAEETARLNMVEHENWEAWHRSKEGGRDGNPRFLNGALSCIAQRVRLFSLAQRDVRSLPPVSPDAANNDYERLSDAELAAFLQLLQESESAPAK